MEVKWTLYQRSISLTQQDEEIPESPMSQGQDQGHGSLSEVVKAIMKDDSTADFTIKCDGKTFEAHKNFLCSLSLLLPLMVLMLINHRRLLIFLLSSLITK